MTGQKLFISKKTNSHLITLIKIFTHGAFLKKKCNRHEERGVATSCIMWW